MGHHILDRSRMLCFVLVFHKVARIHAKEILAALTFAMLEARLLSLVSSVSAKAALLLATLAFTPELRNLSIGSNKGWNEITSKLWKILDALLVRVSLICLLHSSDFGHVTHIFLISKISLNQFKKLSQRNFCPFYHIFLTHTP